MGIVDKIKGMFRPVKGRLDISARFELEKHSFSGTMSKFRVAREIKTNRRMGLKLLDAEKTKLFVDRFKGLNKPSEAEIGMAIRHPRVVETYEFGLTTTGQEFILMEYVHGPGLNSAINDKTALLAPKRLLFIRQMAEAVHAVHQAGFIHRDVCPRNFICHHDFEWLKLIDFGLSVPDKPEFRQPGNRTGTPQFMAPEIVRRRATDKRVDIFALGVSFYKLLTDQHPWGTTDTTGMAALVHDQRPHTDIFELRPDLDRDLGKAINRCLDKDPDKRPDSAERFLWLIRGTESEIAN